MFDSLEMISYNGSLGSGTSVESEERVCVCVCECKQMSGPEQAAVLDAHQTGCWFSCPSVSRKQIQMDNFAKREKQEKWERKKEQQQAQD